MTDRGGPVDQPTGTAHHRVVATAGHVDHGKSTLVRALTGMEPDRLAEERRRGLTLDLGYAWTRLGATTVAFVDVPGHERFVATMLAGAGPAPTALLVVAADDGWSAQSSEHRDVLDLLGVPVLAVVISKADTVAPEQVEAVRDSLHDHLAATTFSDAPVVVTDAVSGRGLDQLHARLAERLDRQAPVVDVGRPRLWVDRSFSVPGAGAVVTGTLGGGTLARGDHVTVLPLGSRHRVRGLQCLGEDAAASGPGTRVALDLGGLDHDEVSRGDAVVGAGPWRATTVADLWLRALPGRRLDATGAWHLHVGSARTVARLRPLADPPAGDHPDTASAAVRVVLDDALPLVAGDPVVIRDAGRRAVAGGGMVADPDPVQLARGRRPREQHAERLAEVVAADLSTRPAALLRLRGGVAGRDRLVAAAGTDQLDGLHHLGEHLLDANGLDRARTAVTGLGAGTHDRDAVARALDAAGLPRGLARAVTDALVADGTLTRTSGGVVPSEHADAAAEARSARATAVLAELDAAPFAPPDLDQIARDVGLDHRELVALIQAGEVVRSGKVAFSRRAVERAAEVLHSRFGHDQAFTAAEAKQAWETTRRYAIPLLEHLDRTGVTRFDGQHRWLRDRSD